MEKRVFGIILTILGIAGLILAAYYFASSSGSHNYRAIAVYLILGAIFFIAGISLIRNTPDRVDRIDRIDRV
jgi:uncharacterized membrane protein